MNVDWDLLADHLGGALTGTPDEDRVAQLVATDPGWAQAASELSAAFEAVTGDLRTLPDPALPDDIAARLDAALAGAAVPPVRPAGPAGTAARPAGESRRPPAHPGTSPPGRARRRRMTRWSAGLAVAAGVATFAAIGLGSWLGNWQPGGVTGLEADGGGDSDAARAPDAGVEDAAPGSASGGADQFSTLVVATGNDYQEETLATTEPPERPGVQLGGQDQPSPPPQAPTGDVTQDEVPGSVPDPLFRLWTDPQARATCLTLITTLLQPPPVSITAVDFATFEGQPALVIWATTGDALRWAWVSGPDCGQVGDPDVRFQTQLS